MTIYWWIIISVFIAISIGGISWKIYTYFTNFSSHKSFDQRRQRVYGDQQNAENITNNHAETIFNSKDSTIKVAQAGHKKKV